MHYGCNSYQALPQLLRSATKDLRQHEHEFDAIVCTGISGLVMASPLSMRLKKPLLVLRKDSESSHGIPGELKGASGMPGQTVSGARVLFVDDFISGGVTLRKCRESIERNGGEIVASYEYTSFMGNEAVGYERLRANDPRLVS